MNQHDMRTALFCTGLFAAGAVMLILYQHSLHTGQIMAAMGANTASADGPAASPLASAASVASLAGTPTPGQENLVPGQGAVVPLDVGAGWLINGGLIQ